MKQDKITKAIRETRAEECRRYRLVYWLCACGQHKYTDNLPHMQKCNCGRWMQWQYPGGSNA